ncbi:hypothetical protein [Streptomyces cyaneofuscatus]|uniref:hypothetical protein n=1 Tax=Streptomyces cyaneofuscatus TaxID=66883 RepID=UPI002F907D90|nr:hypothetical protein OG973_36525 [Streptomyces cyaneofuscatus]
MARLQSVADSCPARISGRTLTYDLSLPRVRERFEPAISPENLSGAHDRIREAATLLARAGRTEGAGDVAALGDLLVGDAATFPPAVWEKVRAAAFKQAARAPGARTLKAPPAPDSGLPPTTWNTCQGQPGVAALRPP